MVICIKDSMGSKVAQPHFLSLIECALTIKDTFRKMKLPSHHPLSAYQHPTPGGTLHFARWDSQYWYVLLVRTGDVGIELSRALLASQAPAAAKPLI